jgi:hypothetical protein
MVWYPEIPDRLGGMQTNVSSLHVNSAQEVEFPDLILRG